jgi:hypothetical protein
MLCGTDKKGQTSTFKFKRRAKKKMVLALARTYWLKHRLMRALRMALVSEHPAPKADLNN